VKPVMRPLFLPMVHSNSATATSPIVTVVGSAKRHGRAIRAVEGSIASVIRSRATA
jgi:hypothetical protein